VNIADEKGRTPLHIAAELGDPVLSDRVLIGGFNVLTCVGPRLICLACPFSPMCFGLIVSCMVVVGVCELRRFHTLPYARRFPLPHFIRLVSLKYIGHEQTTSFAGAQGTP
jgi:hypothetical protein